MYIKLPSRLALILILFILCATYVITPAHAQNRDSSTTIGSNPFGAVESYQRPEDAVEAGVGWERIIFEWRFFQPNGPDDWDTSSIPDQWLQYAQRGGRMVVGLVKNAPNWATGSTLLGANPQGLDLPLDDPRNRWAAFIQKLVRYYSAKWNIHHWIMYNEPDIRPQNTQLFEFAGSVSDYYKIVKVGYKAAHAADPHVVIHLAGLTFWHDVIHDRQYYLERYLRTAYADPEARQNGLFFDVYSVHIFGGTDWVWYITELFKHLPERLGYDKPLWVDEMNARVTEDNGWPIAGGNVTVTVDQQAAFIVQGAALALAAGADHVEVYKLFDNVVADNYEAWGLIRADGTRRPGFYAFQMVTKYFSGATDVQRFKNSYATMVVLTEPGRTVYVVWNRTRKPQYAYIQAIDPNNQNIMLVSMTGEERRLPPGETVDNTYELYLPPCEGSCDIQGAPRILIQPGDPQPGWTLNDKQLVNLS